ncbi:hypothetical protein [Streptomyces rubradiris]|uniref:Uncharacterized protein n=1 Tax=Streptomyces rubradiris TaxID=285531 RepID=A0ABQ3RI77_STRRR|nr:hypothetical protein [Streptomyces rubradiris]GHH21456.1 hypothetical protein GCM10018792_56060 [Streptomyces rubradiris]GHI55566.1 hypothetical protein Srubr_54120 [Streptomyces rubradiris]
MTSAPTASRLSRLCCTLVPLLLLSYGVLRLIDGMDGHHGPGPAWNAGHLCFLAAFLLLGALVWELRALVPASTARRRTAAGAATAAGLFGAACFVWVILGDLFPTLSDTAPLPAPLELAGPLAFEGGLLTLMILLVTTRPRRLPVWSPALAFMFFLLITINLDLLPLAALVLMTALTPLTRPHTLRPAR